MAEQVSAQERLDKIVVLIAANMVAEVCSVYVLRIDNTLELYATEGLNRDAVHRTVLSAHEGLVGLVSSEASPLNLSDAQSHPAFSFRPETGEEIYHSFLGVPILRAGNTLGVLASRGRILGHAERVGRSPRLVETAPRNHGGAGLRPGAAGQDRGPDRGQYGGRGLLDLCAARR